MVGQKVIGQVTVNALDILVRPGVEPGFVFRMQDVVTAAEFRIFRLGVESRQAEGQEGP